MKKHIGIFLLGLGFPGPLVAEGSVDYAFTCVVRSDGIQIIEQTSLDWPTTAMVAIIIEGGLTFVENYEEDHPVSYWYKSGELEEQDAASEETVPLEEGEIMHDIRVDFLTGKGYDWNARGITLSPCE